MTKRKIRILLIFLLLGAFLVAFRMRWSTLKVVEQSRTDFASGAKIVQAQLAHGDETFTLTIVLLAKDRFRAELVDQPKQAGGPSVREIIEGRNAQVGINAGFFEKDFSPSGLLLLRGKTISPKRSDSVLNGIVMIDANGVVQLSRESSYAETTDSAFQTGPILLELGKAVVADLPARARRSVIAKARDGSILLINSTDVSLSELAKVLEGLPDLLTLPAVDWAVNLDGGPSAGLSVRMDGTVLNRAETGPVRSAMVFRTK